VAVAANRRVLYASQTGMTEPLGRAQVVPYLVGLSRAGWQIEVVSSEPEGTPAAAVADVRTLLGDHGIGYQSFTRRLTHDWPTKLRESAQALLHLVARALARRPRLVHARSSLAATVAHLAARLVPRARMLFDCRGLVAEEYVDFGHWRRNTARYHLLTAAEHHLFRRADGIVVLTDRVRDYLRGEAGLVGERTLVEVIPCCVDLDRFRFDERARQAERAALGAGDRFVLAYSGSLGACYSEAEMAKLYAAVRARRPSLFAVFTRSSPERLRTALRALGIPDEELRVRPAAPVEMPALLAAADAAVSFIEPAFSKIASSPTKLAEYLAIGLPVAVNRGIGDQDRLMAAAAGTLVDAGELDDAGIAAAGAALVAAAAVPGQRAVAQELARAHFSLDDVGVARYRDVYERMAAR